MKNEFKKIQERLPMIDIISIKKNINNKKNFSQDYKFKDKNISSSKFSFDKDVYFRNIKLRNEKKENDNHNEINLFLYRNKRDKINSFRSSFFHDVKLSPNIKNVENNNIFFDKLNKRKINNNPLAKIDIKKQFYFSRYNQHFMYKGKYNSTGKMRRKKNSSPLINTQTSIFLNDLSYKNSLGSSLVQNLQKKNNENNLNKKICEICSKEIEFSNYNFHFNFHPSQIFKWLYLGCHRNALDINEINDIGINYVLNCAIECYDKYPNNIKYCHLNLNDTPSFKLLPHLDKATNFINKAKISGGTLLVHCQLGISRSTSCVIAYMIRFMGYTTLSALDYIKKKRPLVMPNYGFLQQLSSYENIWQGKK